MSREEQVHGIRMKMERYLDSRARDKDFYSMNNNRFKNRNKFRYEKECLRGFAKGLEKHYPKADIEEAQRQIENSSQLLYGFKYMGPNFPKEKLEELIQDTNKYGSPRAKEAVQEMKSCYERCGIKEKIDWKIKASRYLMDFCEWEENSSAYRTGFMFGYDITLSDSFGYKSVSSYDKNGVIRERPVYEIYEQVYSDYFRTDHDEISEWYMFEVEEDAIEYYCKQHETELEGEYSKEEIKQWKAERRERKNLWAELRSERSDFSEDKMKRLAELERHPFGGDGIVQLGRINEEFGIIKEDADEVFPEWARVREYMRKQERESEVKKGLAEWQGQANTGQARGGSALQGRKARKTDDRGRG